MNNKLIFIFLATLACITTTHAARNPLHDAAENGAIQELTNLIATHKYDINEQDEDNWTPLHCAAWSGHTECVRILLLSEANVNALNNRKSTPLHLAAQWDYIDCLKVLIEHHAIIDPYSVSHWTPLHYAAKWGNAECAQLLLQHGATIDAITNDCKTAKDLAQGIGHANVVKALQDWVDFPEIKEPEGAAAEEEAASAVSTPSNQK